MGIGAMSVVMLRLPLTSVLLATLLLGSDGLAVMPLVIVAVFVAYVSSAWLSPAPSPSSPFSFFFSLDLIIATSQPVLTQARARTRRPVPPRAGPAAARSR